MTPQRREIWYAHLPLKKDSRVQGGTRPVVIISNDLCNEFNSIITVIPMTRQMKKLELPTHIVVDSQSVVLVEQITTIDKSLLDNKIGEIGEDDMQTIENAIRNQLGMKGGSE